MAAVDYFLKIDGIDGESTDSVFAKNIELQSWSWGETNSGGGNVGGMTAGKVQAQDFHFVTPMSTASAKLLAACAGGGTIKDALLVCRTAGDTPQLYLKIKLQDVLVSSYQTGGSAHGDIRPTDQVSLTFAILNFEYGAQDVKTGKVASLDQKAGYDFKTNKKV